MAFILERLRYCSACFQTESADAVIEQWKSIPAEALECEGFLGSAVFVFSYGAVMGGSLEEKTTAIVGLHQCLSLAAELLPADANERLLSNVLERTLRRFDPTGDALAAKATQMVLYPGQVVAVTTEPLRAVLAMLLRCVGEAHISAVDLLDLARGDVALTVAIIAEGLGEPRPGGLPQWHTRLASMLYQLTTPDVHVSLMQRASPGSQFDNVPISILQMQQSVHNQVVALSIVQFELVDRLLRAAEDVAHRHKVLVSLVRTLHNLVRGGHQENAGRLLSRCITLEFMRLGFRFLAPFMRKLIETLHEAGSSRIFNDTCRTLSWLLVHAEADGNTFLADSVKPLAAEWLSKGTARYGPTHSCSSAMFVLAANVGFTYTDLEHVVSDATLELIAWEAQRCPAFTSKGRSLVGEFGFSIPEQSSSLSTLTIDLENDADVESFINEALFLPEVAANEIPPGGVACVECNEVSASGEYGEGYFEGLWYCSRCWEQWSTSFPDRVFIGPWPSDCGNVDPAEQKGASVLLLQAPGCLRCGISGKLLKEDAVHVPSSTLAAYPVAFERKVLEKWCRRSAGTCPITAQPMDLRYATPAPDGLEAVTAWLREQSISAVGYHHVQMLAR